MLEVLLNWFVLHNMPADSVLAHTIQKTERVTEIFFPKETLNFNCFRYSWQVPANEHDGDSTAIAMWCHTCLNIRRNQRGGIIYLITTEAFWSPITQFSMNCLLHSTSLSPAVKRVTLGWRSLRFWVYLSSARPYLWMHCFPSPDPGFLIPRRGRRAGLGSYTAAASGDTGSGPEALWTKLTSQNICEDATFVH